MWGQVHFVASHQPSQEKRENLFSSWGSRGAGACQRPLPQMLGSWHLAFLRESGPRSLSAGEGEACNRRQSGFL